MHRDRRHASSPHRTRSAWPLAVPIALLALGETAAPDDSPWPSRARAVSSRELADSDCQRCHTTIHAEWAASLHGQAWTDPVYQRAVRKTQKRQRESCHRCHVPQPLLVTGFGLDERQRPRLPETRADELDLGVHCSACHADANGAMHGPHGGETEAHASVRDETFLSGRSDALCLSCHTTQIGPVLPLGRDFERLRTRDATKSCVGCHMPPVERSMAKDGDEEAPVRQGRSHALRGATDAAFVATAFEVTLRRLGDDRLELSLTNQGVGHRTPGLVDRTWKVQADVVDAEGKRVRKADRLRAELGHQEALYPGDAKTWTLATGGEPDVSVQLHVSLTHPDRKLDDTVAIDRLLAPRLSP